MLGVHSTAVQDIHALAVAVPFNKHGISRRYDSEEALLNRCIRTSIGLHAVKTDSRSFNCLLLHNWAGTLPYCQFFYSSIQAADPSVMICSRIERHSKQTA